MSDSKIFSIDPSEPIPDPIASTKTTQATLRFVEQKSSPLNSETVYYSLFESTNQSFACETSCGVCIFPPKSQTLQALFKLRGLETTNLFRPNHNTVLLARGCKKIISRAIEWNSTAKDRFLSSAYQIEGIDLTEKNLMSYKMCANEIYFE